MGAIAMAISSSSSSSSSFFWFSVHKHAILLFLVSVILSFQTIPVSPSPVTFKSFSQGNTSATDIPSLLAIKSVLNDPLGALGSWNESSSANYCEWEGVLCGRQHKRVVVLNISSCGLSGTLSPFVGNLSFLHILNLSNNTFHGNIPPEVGRLSRLQQLRLSNNSFVGEIPASISSCLNLEVFSAGNNKLVGEIPSEFNNLSKLQDLSIYFNKLTGDIFNAIGNLTSLQTISGDVNAFEGSIPDTVGKMTNLSSLALGGNNLTGIIPPSLFNLSSLTLLELSFNQLYGSLPPDIAFTLPRLQILNLAHNNFTGNIPPSLSNLSTLEVFDVTRNNFVGKISINFGRLQNLQRLGLGSNSLGTGEIDDLDFLSTMVNCSSLDEIELENNQFGGMLPNNIGSFSTTLSKLNVEQNKISGPIPRGIGNLVNLMYLSFDRNQFNGSIPDEIGNLRKLQAIYFGGNKFSGGIPLFLENLTILSILDLSHNRLTGTIPSNIGRFQNLMYLLLSQNQLRGTIPSSLFSMPAQLIEISLEENFLEGTLPWEVGQQANLQILDVSNNILSGVIPDTLGKCSNLLFLDMGINDFHGPIPPSLRSLLSIKQIDLSQNKFSGQIPGYFTQFPLIYLNLSYNQFQGEVPADGVFRNLTAISIDGNSGLCAGISQLHLPKCGIKASHHMIIILISCLVAGAAILSVLCLVYCRKRRKLISSESQAEEPFLKVSYEDLLKATQGFSTGNLVGAGNFGSVYKGFLEPAGTLVAVKVLDLQNDYASKSFLAECKALRNIRHRNLVRIVTVCSSIDYQGNDFKAIIYKFLPYGNLERWIHPDLECDGDTNIVGNLSLIQRLGIATDVASALNYLHCGCQIPIVHRDMKPSNVLLDDDMTAHVGDFGLASFIPQVVNQSLNSSFGVAGTIGYTAPEYGLGNEASREGDVYSYGILLLEMMTGKRPTDNIFKDGLSLPKFAQMAFSDGVMEIIDPRLLSDDSEATVEPIMPAEAMSDQKTVCILSMLETGIACSMESPQDRMKISDAVIKLQQTKDIFLGLKIVE